MGEDHERVQGCARPFTRHVGSAHCGSIGARLETRLRNRGAPEIDVGGRAASGGEFPLSGLTAFAYERMGEGGMGRFGKQQACALLHADTSRPKTTEGAA